MKVIRTLLTVIGFFVGLAIQSIQIEIANSNSIGWLFVLAFGVISIVWLILRIKNNETVQTVSLLNEFAFGMLISFPLMSMSVASI